MVLTPEQTSTPEKSGPKQFGHNHCYMSVFTLVMTLSSTLQSGFLLSETNMVGFILAEKLGWNEDGTALYKNTTITTIACLGIAIGSFIGTFFTETQKRLSLQHGMILFNVLGIGANILK